MILKAVEPLPITVYIGWSYLCQCGTVLHEKAAKYFGEEATATSLLSSDDPVVAKKLGSKVCISNKAAWDSACD